MEVKNINAALQLNCHPSAQVSLLAARLTASFCSECTQTLLAKMNFDTKLLHCHRNGLKTFIKCKMSH